MDASDLIGSFQRHKISISGIHWSPLPRSRPNLNKRKIPTEEKIREHWAERLWEVKGFDSIDEFLEPGWCFACGIGFNSKPDRAHILARAWGGDDSLENLHILCSICHKDSENLYGPAYMDWLVNRSMLDMCFSAAVRNGFNVGSLLIQELRCNV